MKENLTVRLSPSMMETVRDIAVSRDVSIAQVIREMLRTAMPEKPVVCEDANLRLARAGRRPCLIHHA